MPIPEKFTQKWSDPRFLLVRYCLTPICRMGWSGRVDTVDRRVRRSSLGRPREGRGRIEWLSFKRALVKRCYIDWTGIITRFTLTLRLGQEWASRVLPGDGLVLIEGAILHGLCSYNIAAVQVLREFGNSDPANFKSFECRFSSPVLPGGTHRFLSTLMLDELEMLMWETGKTVDGAKEIIFETRVNGKAVLANGRALIRTSAGRPKLWNVSAACCVRNWYR